ASRLHTLSLHDALPISAFKMHYTSPWFVPGNGVDSPNILNVNDASYFGFRHSTFSLMAADANKVTYFTPRFAGFQLGLSFTPERSEEHTSELQSRENLV